MAKDVREQINDILTEYIDSEREIIERVAEETANETAKRLKQTSPRSKGRGKHYANGWKVAVDKVIGAKAKEAIVYNSTKPQLTHLLSMPHDIKNQYGEYGRSEPDPHIDNAEEFGVNLFLEKLEREL